MRPSEANGGSPGPRDAHNGTSEMNGNAFETPRPMTPRERDERIQKGKLLDRLGKRKSIGTPVVGSPNHYHNHSIAISHHQTPGRGLGTTPGPKQLLKPLSIDELHKKYETALLKYAQNQLNQKTAFSDDFLEILPQFSKNALTGQANYKVLSGVLELGTAHYAVRVENVHSEAQRVASGLTMALGDGRRGREDAGDEEGAENQNNNEDDEQRQKRKREKTKRTVKTITENPDSLNQAKTEMSVEDHPLIKRLERFRSSQEETSVHLLLLTHLELSTSLDLLLDAAALRDKPQSELTTSGMVSLKPFTKIINEVCGDESIKICPSVASFDFSNRDTASMWDSSSMTDLPSQRFDVNQPYDDDYPEGSMFDGPNFDEDSCDLPGPDGLGNASVRPRASLQMMNVDDYLNLIKKGDTDYTFVDSRLWHAWAGPSHWKANMLAKAQQAKAGLPPGAVPTTARKSKRLEFQQLQFDKADVIKAAKPIKLRGRRANTKLSLATLNKWDENAKERTAYIPHDHSYSVLSLMHPHLLPEYTFHCEKTVDEVNESIRSDHDYDQIGSPRNFDVDDNASDDGLMDFGGDQMMEDDAEHQDAPEGLLELVDAPWQSSNIQINYATQAKRIDVKQLKSALWRVVSTVPQEPGSGSTPERNKTNGEAPEKSPRGATPDLHPAKFTAVYTSIKSGQVPMSRVTTSHISFPIAFCTLLHLANEHNLELEPEQDLSDFVIKLQELQAQQSFES